MWFFTALAVAALALGSAPAEPALAGDAAACTTAQKRVAQRALATFQRGLAQRRAAYFRTHPSKAQRNAFVRRESQRLRALKRAAACTVDVAPPRLTSATANEATLTLRFDDTLAGAAPPPAAFTVTVDGLRWRVESATLAGRSVALRLGLGVNAGEAVAVSYEMPATNPLRDAAGRYSAAFRTNASNTTPAAPPPPAEPGYSPVIPKPSFADSRVIPDPWVGEWGPKTDPYWLPSTGALRGLVIPVDFADAPSTRTVEFYRDYLGPTSESYFRENSYGRLAFTLAAFPRWLRMPGTMASWAARWSQTSARKEFLATATALADAEVDFSTVDAVFVVAPESVAGQLYLSLVRAWPGEGVARDGHELRWAVVGGGGIDPRGPSANLAAHHIVTHETGHFFGLADLYDQARRGTPDQFAWSGRWDLMGDNRASAHLSAWNKWLLRWLDPTQLRGLTTAGSTEAELTPLARRGGLKAVVVPISPWVVYVIENRRRIGEDSELCDDGVLVWIVDGSRWNVDRNAIVQPARRSYNDDCGAIFDAGYDLGANEVSVFDDALVRVEVLSEAVNGNYRVRVTRK